MRKNRSNVDIVPIYSPRTSYKRIKATDERMMADMTLNFDKITINLLKEQFLKRNNELNLQEFIMIAKKHLKFWQMDVPNRQIALMRYLTFLFNEIDINGNGDMEWEEFTNYIIEKATVLKNLKSKADEVKQYIRSNVKPKIKIDGLIHKTEYIPDMDRIAFYEEGSNKIYFMNVSTGEINTKTLQINPKKLVVNISSVKKEKNGKVGIRKKDLIIPTSVRVLDMIYLSEKKYRILLVSTSDGFVRGWKYGQNGFVMANQPDNEEQPFQHFFLSEIYCLAWDYINEVLYCGQKTGLIYMWNLKTDLEKALPEIKNGGSHKEATYQTVNNMITSMITMPKLQFMASGRMDGKLILWDTISNQKKWTYKQHSRGILTLAFNQAMILLFSAGFDHKICIWNPYISTLIHKIEGHLAPILSLKVVEGTHQLISMDSQGIVKITDTRRFNFIHSFSVETREDGQSSALTSLIIISKPLKLVFAGRSIAIYEYDKNYNPHTADQYTATCCKYAKDKLCFFTPMGNKIKVWSALNGDVQRIYMDVTPHEISTFQFDFLKKRMIVGDTKGNINLHNTANGAKMKSLSKHAGQITHLIATQNGSGVDFFISSSLDNEIRVTKQTEQSYQVVRTIYIRKDASITCLQYCSQNKLIMVGTNVGTLAFYEIQTGKTLGTCLNKPHQQFTSICRTNQPIIIATTSTGKVSFVAIPPFPNRFEKLLSFYHQDCEKVNATLGVRACAFSSSLECMFIVDDKMYLTCYNLKDIHKGLNSNDFKKEKIEAERRHSINRIFETVTIKEKWQIKAHTEVIKSLQYIQEEQLLITTSFDKKVKIWAAENGEFLDSLQQNYNKADSVPLSYYDTKSQNLYSYNRKKTIPNVAIDPSRLQFDPFIFTEVMGHHKTQYEKFVEGGNKYSNRDWKISVDFKDVVYKEMNQFQELAVRIAQKEENNDMKENAMISKTVDIWDIKRKLIEKRKFLKDINENMNNGVPPTLDRKIDSDRYETVSGQLLNTSNSAFDLDNTRQSKKLSSNYFKRSLIKCVQNFVDRNDNDPVSMISEKNRNAKRIRDFIPIIEHIKKSSRNSQEIREHKEKIENLYRTETESLLRSHNQNKVFMSREEANAAGKLCKLLIKTDSKDKRPEIMYKSIQIKDRRVLPLIL